MKGKLKKEQIKKIIFLAAVLAAGILIYVLFGREPVNEEVITFTETPAADPAAASPAPREAELIEVFEAALPEENFRAESSDKDSAVYVLPESASPITLTLALSDGYVTALEMLVDLPNFPEPLSADASMVEKNLREKRQQALETAVTDCIYRFQLLTEQYEMFYPDTGRPGLAADTFREALLEGRSDRVESDGWQYDLFSLRSSDTFTAKMTVIYLGDMDKEG